MVEALAPPHAKDEVKRTMQAVVPEYMVPFVTVLEEGEEPFAMFRDLWVKHRDWVFAPVGYATVDELAQGLDVLVKRAPVRSAELVARKAETVRVERMRDLLGDVGPTPSIDPLIDPP